jgi:phosphoribosylglycinamide formyltransferase-1
MKKVLLFASGSGSNVENIIVHLEKNSQKTVFGIMTNNPNAKVIERAKKLNIEALVFNKSELNDGKIKDKVVAFQPDLIVLAGFLLQFPRGIVELFPNKIINIHPSLLPKYGGKGMYGKYVHEAVLQNKEKETGITIHFVNEKYDDGAIIFQKSISIEDCKTSDDIANKVQLLEANYFPEVVAKFLNY